MESPTKKIEPFGAYIWKQRTEKGIPLCWMADFSKIDMPTYSRIELGWITPPQNEWLMHVLERIYELSAAERSYLDIIAEISREQGPCDLTQYLGIGSLPFKPKSPLRVYDPNAAEWDTKRLQGSEFPCLEQDDRKAHPPQIATVLSEAGTPVALRPNVPTALVVPKRIPLASGPATSLFRRIYVKVRARIIGRNKVIPQDIVWDDGRLFHIDRVESAMESAALETGGVGTKYSCIIRGKRRNLCFETVGNWFMESPILI